MPCSYQTNAGSHCARSTKLAATADDLEFIESQLAQCRHEKVAQTALLVILTSGARPCRI
jgi:hypothetical protein